MRFFDGKYSLKEARQSFWDSFERGKIKYENGFLSGNTFFHKDVIKIMFKAVWVDEKKAWKISDNFKEIFK